MSDTEYVKIQMRRDSYANWQSVNPILANGEFALDTTNKTIKIGNGTTRWAELHEYEGEQGPVGPEGPIGPQGPAGADPAIIPAGFENDLLALDGAGGIKGVDSGAYATPADLTVIDANVQTASYTLVIGDAGKAVEMNLASANNLTVPPNSSVAFPTGTVVEVCQVGAGLTTIVAGSGVTINTPETLVLSGQWSTVSLRKRGTDLWVLAGDVAAA